MAGDWESTNRSMRLLAWNVNSIKTLRQYHPWCDLKYFKDILDSLCADIFCLQETKISRDKVERDFALPDGYHAFFSFCSLRKGYSGVATFVKISSNIPVVAAFDGFVSAGYPIEGFDTNELNTFDIEGRLIITDHKLFILFNVYCPNETSDDRRPYKMRFYQALEESVKYVHSQGRLVIIAGDINACRAEIDHCDPKRSNRDYNLAEFSDHPARKWLNSFIATEVEDLYRYFHPNEINKYTCWNTLLNARPANYGTRIDFILVSRPLLDIIKTCAIESQVMGSDHCPISCDMDWKFDYYQSLQTSLPRLATKFYPEFSTRQKTLDSFLVKKSPAIKSQNLSPLETNKSFHTKDPDNQVILLSDESSEVDILDQVKKIDEVSKREEINMKKWSSIPIGKTLPAPKCYHGDECKEYSVNKTGPNKGKKFFLCSRHVGPGYEDNKNSAINEYRCNFFQWKTNANDSSSSTSTKRKKSVTTDVDDDFGKPCSKKHLLPSSINE